MNLILGALFPAISALLFILVDYARKNIYVQEWIPFFFFGLCVTYAGFIMIREFYKIYYMNNRAEVKQNHVRI